MSNEESDERKSDHPWPHRSGGHREKAEDMKLWGILIFGLIGATATTFAFSRSQSSWRDGRSFRSSFQEETWKKYNQNMKKNLRECQHSPDQNQDKKEFAEAKFKEVMVFYEAIKTGRKNNSK